ncbi:hypothetical protein MTR_2g062420 [Medicago truncatula]|uniref:Uncharacterized protein n=1 Tax=Medicago truncatula TaxID=3880 RepID=G7IQP6_MEDTR|nr:hypothetical protein MTR_2g062420 [Medicago truncatula]
MVSWHDTICEFVFWKCYWKNRGTMQEIRSSIVLLPTPMWHDGLATWHGASGSGHYLRLHSSSMQSEYSKMEMYPYQIRIRYRYFTDTRGYVPTEYRN